MVSSKCEILLMQLHFIYFKLLIKEFTQIRFKAVVLNRFWVMPHFGIFKILMPSTCNN